MGRVLPGVLNLVALALYTRLLSPADFGRYMLVIAGVVASNVVAFYWLRVAAVRQLPDDELRRSKYVGALYATYVRVALLVIVTAGLMAWMGPPSLRSMITLGALVLLSQSWFELNLDLQLASLNAGAYAALAISRAALGVGLGAFLATRGYGPTGVLLGAAVGYAIPAVPASLANWHLGMVLNPDTETVRHIMRFGLPLAAAVSVGLFSNGIDRFLLGGLAGTEAVGQYGAAADLTFQTSMALMMVVSLSALPLAARALEADGPSASARQLERQGVILVAIGLPACAGLAVLAPLIAATLLGDSFRHAAGRLIPVIAIGTLFAGVRMFFFDIGLQVANATKRQFYISLVGAILSLALNLWLIPTLGVTGAAYAMLTTFLATCVMSGFLVQRALPVVVPVRQWLRALVAAAIMVAILIPLRAVPPSVSSLAVVVLVGFLVYAGTAVALDVGGGKSKAFRLISRLRHPRSRGDQDAA